MRDEELAKRNERRKVSAAGGAEQPIRREEKGFSVYGRPTLVQAMHETGKVGQRPRRASRVSGQSPRVHVRVSGSSALQYAVTELRMARGHDLRA
jgi:hypothetical protein